MSLLCTETITMATPPIPTVAMVTATARGGGQPEDAYFLPHPQVRQCPRILSAAYLHHHTSYEFFCSSGRKPSFNIQCLRRQGSSDDLPIPGTYHPTSPPRHTRTQVKHTASTHTHTNLSSSVKSNTLLSSANVQQLRVSSLLRSLHGGLLGILGEPVPSPRSPPLCSSNPGGGGRKPTLGGRRRTCG